MYTVLYVAMFALQFNKMRNQKKVKKTLAKFGKDFLGSLAFMSWLVGGMKTSLCILNGIGSPLDSNFNLIKFGLYHYCLFQDQFLYYLMTKQNRHKFPISQQFVLFVLFIFFLKRDYIFHLRNNVNFVSLQFLSF